MTQKNNKNKVDITVRIDKLNNSDSNVKAFVSANIAGAFAIHGIKVIQSQKGLFVSMPQSSYTKQSGKTEYKDIFHAITKEARDILNDEVIKAYENALEETEENAEEIEEDEEMVQSM